MLNKLTNRVYYMDFVQQGDRPVLGLVVGDNYSVIIDGGNSKAHAQKFLNYITELDVPKPKYLLLTHWHWDHVWGMKTMNLINIAHEKSNEKIEWLRTLEWTDDAIQKRVENGEEIEFCQEHIKIEHPGNDRKMELPHIDIIFNDRLELELGGVNVCIEHCKSDHSEDCCLVRVEEEGVTFMGDAMYLDMYSGEWSYSKEKLYPFLEKLRSYDSKYYIPSHHPKYTKSEFMKFIKYIKNISQIVGESTDLEKSIKNASEKRGELSQFDIDDIKGFVEGNKKKL